MPAATFFAASGNFMAFNSVTTAAAFSPGCLLALLGVDRLEHFCHIFHLGFGHNREHIPVEMNHTALVLCLRKRLSHSFQHTQTLVSNNEFDALKASALSHWKKLTQLALSSFIPSAAPKTLTVSILIDCNCH